MQIEVPADIAAGLATIWGEGRYLACYAGQTTRLAPLRRVFPAARPYGRMPCLAMPHPERRAMLRRVRRVRLTLAFAGRWTLGMGPQARPPLH